ncbi:hypothetical protein BURK2_04521 [Burkholderiales bacterium]|nr:hypothetical protein BURK2_04521 [Burkholderiales bacterium]
MISSIFQAATWVSSGLALVAFAYACVVVVQMSKNRADWTILKGTDDARKAEVIDALSGRLRLDVSRLTKAQTYELAKVEVEKQGRKERRQFVLTLVALLLSASFAFYSIMVERGPVDLTFRAVDDKGAIVFSERMARISVALPSGTRQADFTRDGQAVIKGVPRNVLDVEYPVKAEVYYFDQLQENQSIRLTLDVMDVVMHYNPVGTPEGLRNLKAANLLLLKLLSPYRVIAKKAKGATGETSLQQYCEADYQKTALGVDLNTPISRLNVDLKNAFDVLTENEPTAVPRATDTLGELIERSAVEFKIAVNAFSTADPLALDPRVRRELLALTQSNFVEIASSGVRLSFGSGRLHSGFLSDLCYATKDVSTKKILNPFSTFYRM